MDLPPCSCGLSKLSHDTERLENVLKSLFDGNDEILSIQGYFGNDPNNVVNLNVIVGKIEKIGNDDHGRVD